MLEALKQFDWATLEGDPSPHVPIWLVALTSTVKEESSRANAKLSDYLIPWQVLEWGMYNSEEIMASIDREVIIVTIPFLIKLACSGEITDTAGILEILHDLVCYSGIEERIAQVVLVKYRYLARRIYGEVDKGQRVINC